MEIEMLRIIGNVLNISLNIENFVTEDDVMPGDKKNESEKINGNQIIFVTQPVGLYPEIDYLCEYTHN